MKKSPFYDFIITFVISIIPMFFIDFNSNFALKNFCFSFLKIYTTILPIVYTSRRKFFLKTNAPLKCEILIIYYLIILPFTNLSLDSSTKGHLELLYSVMNILNLTILLIMHYVLFKYIYINLIRNRRIKISDIAIVFGSYITLALSFGLVFTIISLLQNYPCITNIKSDSATLTFYFDHIYFSFVTIATVGYGDYAPANGVARFFSVIEVLCGILMTNIVLGLIIGSGIFSVNNTNNEEE